MTKLVPKDDAPEYGVRAVDRVCDLLDLLQRSAEGVSLVDLANSVDLAKSTAFRYLWTLEERRYVERDATTGDYSLGLGFLSLQARQLDFLRLRARPHLERLRDELGETINLGLLDGSRVIYLEIVESQRAMRLAARLGDRDPMHCTALGKAIAATLPEQRVRTILQEDGMPRMTPNTITTVKGYLSALNTVRDLGYALDDGENEPDGRCVAVHVPGTLPAAISMSAPMHRFHADDVGRVAQRLVEAANELGRAFGGRNSTEEPAEPTSRTKPTRARGSTGNRA